MAHGGPNPHAEPALDNFECLLLDPVPVGGGAGQPRWQDGFELKYLALSLGSGADDGNELTSRQAQYPVLAHRCPHHVSMPHPTWTAAYSTITVAYKRNVMRPALRSDQAMD